MRKPGGGATQSLDNLDLCGRIGHMIRPAHDVGDGHFHIIDDRSKGIQDLAIFLDQHRIAQ